MIFQVKFLMNEITQIDLSKLKDFIKKYKDDKDSPIVFIAEIVEKLARQNYK